MAPPTPSPCHPPAPAHGPGGLACYPVLAAPIPVPGPRGPPGPAAIDTNWEWTTDLFTTGPLRMLHPRATGLPEQDERGELVFPRGPVATPSTTTGGAAARLVFDASTGGSLRAGSVAAGQWDQANRGRSSFAAGVSGLATGVASTALGENGTASGEAATVAGGDDNTASGSLSFVGAGRANLATATGAFVGAGDSVCAIAPYAFAGAGTAGLSSGTASFIGAGLTTQAMATAAACVAGIGCQTTGTAAFLGAGSNNRAPGGYAFLGAGSSNRASGDNAFAGAGTLNTASGNSSGVVCGQSGVASGSNSAVLGGSSGTASGTNASVLGGLSSSAAGYCALAGGIGCSAAGSSSVALGSGASAPSQGMFVFSDGLAATTGARANALTGGFGGGYVLWTNTARTIGAELPPGGSSWTFLCSRDAKLVDESAPVDDRGLLRALRRVPVHRFRYRDAPDVEHLGPVAEDFNDQVTAPLRVGHDRARIAGLDLDAALLAAVRALDRRVSSLQRRSRKAKGRGAGRRVKTQQQRPPCLPSDDPPPQ